MARAWLWLFPLLGACGKGHRVQSIVLTGEVSDFPGTGAPVCPLRAIDEVRTTRDAVLIDGAAYPVDGPAEEQRFLDLLALCGRTEAAEAFTAWREAERKDADDAASRPVKASDILAPATEDVDMVPLHERRPEHAWAQDYVPPGNPAPAGPRGDTVALQQAFIDLMELPVAVLP